MALGHPRDGRLYQPALTLKAVATEGGLIELRSPSVGFYRGAPAPGAHVVPGSFVGELEVLGKSHQLIAGEGARGLVAEGERRVKLARRPVSHGDVLLRLDPQAGVRDAAIAAGAPDPALSGLVFRAPSSGRFYGRPAPDKPAFVSAGDEVSEGQAVALLEIMKTFHRIAYGGEGLPPKAKVKRVVPNDGDDLEIGDPILELDAG